jgi:hypothetical protein
MVGFEEGWPEGLLVVGTAVGVDDGRSVGCMEGFPDGWPEG